MFTVRELQKIQRHLFHSQPDRIYQLLRQAYLKGTTPKNLRNLETITRKCRLPSSGRRTKPLSCCVATDRLRFQSIFLHRLCEAEVADRVTCS